MLEALAVWTKYPKQIATSLRSEYSGVHIRQWLRGEMSSREFMELVEGLPAESWFKQDLFADLKRDDINKRRAEMDWSAADFEARLRGEIRDPWDMTAGKVEKHVFVEE